jgi:hypothetical protein
MKRKPITKLDKILDFANTIKPYNFYILKQGDDLKWPIVRKIKRRRKNVIIVNLSFRDKQSTNEEGEFAKIYGPVEILENVAISQIIFFPFYYKAKWKVAVMHCFAHILADAWKNNNNYNQAIKLNEIGNQCYESTDHGRSFRSALLKLLKNNPTANLDKWSIVEVLVELEIYKIINPDNFKMINNNLK